MPITRVSGSKSNLLAWVCGVALLGAALLAYLLDPVTQRFETWPFLSGLFGLVTPFLPAVDVPYAVRFWLPDFAWAWLAALVAAEALGAWRTPARPGQPSRPGKPVLLCILLAACSWEMLQWLGLVGGVFDVIDLAVSLCAGMLVMLAVIFLRDNSRRCSYQGGLA